MALPDGRKVAPGPAGTLPRMRQVRVFEGDDALGALDKRDDLLVASDAPTTARSMWLRCYAGAYRDVVPVVVVVEDDGR